MTTTVVKPIKGSKTQGVKLPIEFVGLLQFFARGVVFEKPSFATYMEGDISPDDRPRQMLQRLMGEASAILEWADVETERRRKEWDEYQERL